MSTAQVKLRIVIDGDAIKSVNSLTGEVKKLTSAEDEFQKKVQNTKRIYDESVSSAKRFTAAAKASMDGGGSMSGLAGRIGNRGALGSQGLQGVGGIGGGISGGVASAASDGGGLGSMLSSGLGRFLGPAMIASTAYKIASVETAMERDKFTNPWATMSDRAESRASRYGLDNIIRPFRAAGGLYERLGIGEQEYQRKTSRIEHEGKVAEFRRGLDNQYIPASNLEKVYKDYKSPGRDMLIDRGTALGKKLFEEESRLLPAKKDLHRSTIELAAAQETAAEMQSNSVMAQKRLADSEKKAVETNESWKKSADSSDLGGNAVEARYMKLLAADLAQKELTNARSAASAATEQSRESQLKLSQARANQAASSARVEQANAQNLMAREDVAANEAQRLGMMGPIERMAAKNALERYRVVGLDGLTGEEKSMISSVAPETLRTDAERIGARRVAEFRPYAPQDYRDDLTTVRRDASEAMKRTERSEDKASELAMSGVASVIKDFGDKLVLLMERELSTLIMKVEQAAALANRQNR